MDDNWLDVNKKPMPHGKLILAGLFVNYQMTQDFTYHLILLDPETGQIYDNNGDYYDCWNWDDYEYWQPLEPPK